MLLVAVGGVWLPPAYAGLDGIAIHSGIDATPFEPVALSFDTPDTRASPAEPVAVPLPTAAQSGIVVIAVAALWRAAKRMRARS
jgi:hypothetical protein